jgi:hypothetical protein
MCSGLFIWALSEEYKVTADPEVISLADTFFENITVLIEESFRIEKGFLGKPWGGKPSMNTTLDQTLYLCMGLHVYSQVADSAHSAKASEIITAVADWWISRGYRHFGHNPDIQPCWLGESHGGGMLAQIYLAFLHGKYPEIYAGECEKLIKKYNVDKFPVRRSGCWYMDEKNGRMFRIPALWHHAYALSLWLLTANCPARENYWQERFADQWHKELKLGLREDGLAYMAVKVDLADESDVSSEVLQTAFVDKILEHHRKNVLLYSSTPARSAYFAAHIGLSGALLADAVPWMRGYVEQDIKSVLEQLDFRQMTWVYPEDKKLCGKRSYLAKSLTSKGITAWLCAYWISRRLKIV